MEVKQLGINGGTSSMHITYALQNCTSLLVCIDKGWVVCLGHTQKKIATLLDSLSSTSVTLPIGSYFSIRLQK